MEGAESSTSLVKRTILPYALSRAYSASQVPASTPTTTAMTMAAAQSISEPTIALAKPPGSPVDMVRWVNTVRLIPLNR